MVNRRWCNEHGGKGAVIEIVSSRLMNSNGKQKFRLTHWQ